MGGTRRGHLLVDSLSHIVLYLTLDLDTFTLYHNFNIFWFFKIGGLDIIHRFSIHLAVWISKLLVDDLIQQIWRSLRIGNPIRFNSWLGDSRGASFLNFLEFLGLIILLLFLLHDLLDLFSSHSRGVEVLGHLAELNFFFSNLHVWSHPLNIVVNTKCWVLQHFKEEGVLIEGGLVLCRAFLLLLALYHLLSLSSLWTLVSWSDVTTHIHLFLLYTSSM